MGKRTILILYWVSFILLLILFVVAPRGYTREMVEGGIDQFGDAAVSLSTDSFFDRVYTLEMGSGEFIKRDFAFVVYYEHKLKMDLSGVPEGVAGPVSLSVTAPGQIIYANADQVEKNKATWLIRLGKSYDLRVISRRIRWWLIGLASVSVLLLGYAHFYLKRFREPPL